MSSFPAIVDFSDTSLVLHTLREVGKFFHGSLQEPRQAQEAPPLRPSLPDEAYRSAVEVLHPLGRYLQHKASDAQREQLGDAIAADPHLTDHLYEGILIPFSQGI